MTTPAPGSDEALALGCTCPVLDNGHGKGFMGIEGYYVIAEGCPLHPMPVSLNAALTARPELRAQNDQEPA